MKLRSFHRQAFTLVELAAVLLVVGLMVGFGMQAAQVSTNVDCYAQTRTQMVAIKEALRRFADNNGRLPTPAGRSFNVSSANYGREASGADIDTLSSGAYATNPALFGALPFQALQLPTSFATDCWGNKFSYVVGANFTTTSGYTATTDGPIEIRRGTLGSNVAVTTKATYAVISHGSDALGAVKGNYGGASHGWCSTGTRIDSENCDLTNAILYYTDQNNGTNPASFSDDLVSYGEKSGFSTNLYCWGTDSGVGALADNNSSAHAQLTPKQATNNIQFASFVDDGSANAFASRAGLCALKADGQLFCWGENTNYFLGDGTTTNRAQATPVGGSNRFKKLYLFETKGAAIDTNNKGFCWAQNYGACPAPSSTSVTQFNGAFNFQSIVGTGIQHMGCGLALDETAYCWGSSNYYAAKGRGIAGNTSDSVPVAVNGGRKFAKLVGFGSNSPITPSYCGLTSSADPLGAGKLYCWGGNDTGNLATGDQVARDVPTLVAGHSFSNVFASSRGGYGMFAVGATTDANPGRLYAWGANALGWLGIGGVNAVDYGYDNATTPQFIVTNVTQSNPGVVTTSTPHGFSNGDTVNFYNNGPYGSGGGMPPLNGTVFTVANVTATTFELQYNGANYNTSTPTTQGYFTPWPADAAITGITQSNPAVVTTASPHGYSTGMKVCIRGVSGMFINNYCPYVGATTANTFELQGLDSTSLGTYTSGGTAGANIVVSKKPPGCRSGATSGWAICKSTPTLVNSTLNFINLTSQNNSNIALTDTGEVWGWGAGYNNQLTAAGVGAVISPIKLVMPGNAAIQRINANSSNANCAWGRNKKIYCWGSNALGAAGTGNTSNNANVVLAAGGYDYVDYMTTGNGAAACGIRFTAGKDCDATTTSWGGSCSGFVPPMANGTTHTVNTTTAYIGSIDASCSNGVVSYGSATCYAAAPPPADGVCDNTTALGCSVGTATGDNGMTACTQTRTWYCSGIYGGNVSAQCSRYNGACPLNGVCNNSTPLGCTQGGAINDNGQSSCGQTRTWQCSGSGGGSDSATCSYSNAACAINGVCNNASPLGCASGTATSDNGQTSCGTTRTWVCAGQYGGSNSGTCSFSNGACAVNGVCDNATALGCSAGTATSDNGQTSCGTTRTWVCAGQNGGSNSATCSLANPSCGGGGPVSRPFTYGDCSPGTSYNGQVVQSDYVSYACTDSGRSDCIETSRQVNACSACLSAGGGCVGTSLPSDYIYCPPSTTCNSNTYYDVGCADYVTNGASCN